MGIFRARSRGKPTKKNDGAIATIMAIDRAIRHQDKTSVYNSRGILIL